MYEIVNGIDAFKTRFSTFTNRLRSERHGYCSFLEGVLYTRLDNIVLIQQFVETVQLLSDRKKITLEQQKLLLLTAYERPSLIHDIFTKILQQFEQSAEIRVQDEIEKLKKQKIERAPESTFEKKEADIGSGSATPPLHSAETEPMDPIDLLDEEEKKRHLEELASIKYIEKMQEEERMRAANSETEEANCEICACELYDEKWMLLDACGHIFHTDCMKESFKININERKFPLKCPNSTCGKQITDLDIRQIVGKDLYNQYQEFAFKNYVDTHGNEMSWCPTADCKHCFFFAPEDDNFSCPQCKKDYCMKCRVEWHKNMTCKEFQINNTFNEDDKKFIEFVKVAKFKQCPKCRYWVEKNMGCDHMSCRCGYQFCYKCGGKYGQCECIKEAQERMRQQQARAEERRKKKLEAQERRKEKERKKEETGPKAPTTRRSARNK